MEPFLNLFRKPLKATKAALPDETKRLEDLYAYEILDTLPEQDFEELVALAAQVSGCPIASITFIDKDRQWFKASRGLPVPETHRDISFCTHTIALEGDLVVEDARKDKRFASNPFVTAGLEVVFYAGTPIYSGNGYKLGTVCVIDQKTRSLTEAQMASLKTIAKQVTHLLDLRLRTRLLQERSERLMAENQKSFEAFFANDTLPKWIYELETLRILQVNEAAIQRYGVSRDVFLKLTVFDFRDSNEPEEIRQLVQTLNEGQASVSFETVHRLKNGISLPVEVMISNISYGGKPARLATMNDISEKHALRLKVNEGRTEIQSKQVASTPVLAEMGREVHHRLNEVLSITKLYLEIAGSNPDMNDKMIGLSRENISRAIKDLRLLEKTEAKDFNLVRSLDEIIHCYLSAGKFKIELLGSSDIDDLPTDIKITAFRIIEQALDNVAKHAEATAVSIDISMNHNLSITIIDNGKGFDPSSISEAGGINSLRNRVEFYNGKIEVACPQGIGCRFYVELPVENV